MISALDQTKAVSEAIRAGAQDFIVKPFLPEQLQKTMDCYADTAVADLTCYRSTESARLPRA